MKLPGVPTRILAAAVLLTLTLIGIVLREGAARAEGQEVRLDIQGYDPRSLLSGHYVRFGLGSEQPFATPCASTSGSPPYTWLALKPAGPRHVLAGQGPTRNAAEKFGGVIVRGTAVCVGASSQRPSNAMQPPTLTTFDLGIDRLYVDQTQAEALQKALQVRDAARQPAYAVISVGKDGKARLKGLIVGGRRVDLGWF